MPGCFSQSVARSVGRSLTALLLVLVAACSSGSGERGRRPKPTASPTTAPAATIDLSKPIPGGSLHGTPRPPLENTGDDYVAIFKSLDANIRWLTENPDPTVVSEIYVPGTPEHANGARLYQELVDKGWRAADEGYRLLSVDVVEVQPQVVSLRVVDQFDVERIVDTSGKQVGGGKPHSGPQTWTVLLSPDRSARWMVADWSPANGGEVAV
jgi:hypothetical protein